MMWLLIDLAFGGLHVIHRREHREEEKVSFPGCLPYERALRANSACIKVHSMWVPSFAIPQRTTDLGRLWHHLINAVSTVTVKVSVKQR